MSPEQFEQGLNPAQREAVVHGEGPMLVLAGAGSGKTRVITHRIARLLAMGVPAQAILAVTFTNKAAAEMHERVVDLVGARASAGLTVCTFHAFGLQFLQRESRYLGFGTGFSIFDASDAVGVIRELMREVDVGALAEEQPRKEVETRTLGTRTKRANRNEALASGPATDAVRRLDASAILSRISLGKNAFHDESTFPDGGDLEGDAALYQAAAKLLYRKYQSSLRGFHALDFDDLICEPVRILQKFPELREKWQRRFRYLLVDEYQDTNRAQLELLRAVTGEHRNLTVVGDDDQSIYAWRGADVTNILAFEDHFPGAHVVKLEQNYRSRSPILQAANAVVGAMPAKKYPKALFTTRDGGDRIQRVVCATPEVEASFVGSEIERQIQGGRKPSEIAVMYRSNGQAAAIEEALRERGIAYQLFGGQAFFERKEVKDLLAYLRLSLNPLDEMSLRRVINYPARGIGEQALHRLEAFAIAADVPLFRAVQRADEIEGLSPAARAGCAQLAEIVVDAKAAMISGKPASRAARDLAERVGLRADVFAGSPSGAAAERRWNNVEGLYRSLERFEKRADEAAWDLDAKRTPSVSEFLQRLLLRVSGEEEAETEQVTLTTLHGAKGLEYEVVFLIGLEEGILPHKRTIDPRAIDVIELKTDVTGAVVADDSAIEEERRLFYVGVTRARERLYLCNARARSARGQSVARMASRFLVDVPAELCEAREVNEIVRLNPAQLAERTQKAIAGFSSRPKF